MGVEQAPYLARMRNRPPALVVMGLRRPMYGVLCPLGASRLVAFLVPRCCARVSASDRQVAQGVVVCRPSSSSTRRMMVLME